MENFTYKKDVIIGTWVAIGIFALTGFAALIHFERATTPPEPVKTCDVCRWTN